MAAKVLVSLLGSTVEGQVDAQGPVLGQELGGLPIDEGAVGIDADLHAHAAHAFQNFKEFGVQERFAAGKKGVQQALLAGTGGHIQPPVGIFQAAGLLDLGHGFADVAHLAAQVTDRKQLEGAHNGNAVDGGFVRQTLAKGFHLITPSSVSCLWRQSTA